MSIHNQEIAERLRTIRELSDLTPEALAAKMGVDPEEYKKYESAAVDIPISLLYDVSNTLGVSITELLTGEQPKLHTASIVRAGLQRWTDDPVIGTFLEKCGERIAETLQAMEQ